MSLSKVLKAVKRDNAGKFAKVQGSGAIANVGAKPDNVFSKPESVSQSPAEKLGYADHPFGDLDAALRKTESELMHAKLLDKIAENKKKLGEANITAMKKRYELANNQRAARRKLIKKSAAARKKLNAKRNEAVKNSQATAKAEKKTLSAAQKKRKQAIRDLQKERRNG